MARVNTSRVYGKPNMNTARPKASTTAVAEIKKPSAPIAAPAKTGAKIITKSVPVENKSFPFVLVLFALICTSMVMLMVFNYAKRYEASVELSNQQKTLARLESELATLEAQNETAVSSYELQSYGVEELGYVPEDQLPYRVVSVERQDKIVSSEQDEQKGGFEMFLSTIKSLFE